MRNTLLSINAYCISSGSLVAQETLGGEYPERMYINLSAYAQLGYTIPVQPIRIIHLISTRLFYGRREDGERWSCYICMTLQLSLQEIHICYQAPPGCLFV